MNGAPEHSCYPHRGTLEVARRRNFLYFAGKNRWFHIPKRQIILSALGLHQHRPPFGLLHLVRKREWNAAVQPLREEVVKSLFVGHWLGTTRKPAAAAAHNDVAHVA